jgi:hypothetical protein
MREVMKNVKLISGIVLLILGIIITMYVKDTRAVYSGGFFIVLGIFLMLQSRRESGAGTSDEKK